MDEYDVLGGYLPSFVQHLKDTRTRFGSQDTSGTGGEAADADAHTSSTWTPAEHDAFFRAVAVHSRWRPDLIAACVPTKTEWEVWMYLEALEEGVAMQVDRSSADSDSDEVVCEPALEVSQAWIDVEERMASWIVEQEHLTSVERGTVADSGCVDEKKRKRGRPHGSGRGRTQSRARVQAQEGSPSLPHGSPSEPQKLSAARAERREALMGRLEVPHLLVLDSILREGEEAIKGSREGSVAGVTVTEHGDENVGNVSPDLQGTIDSVVIDPVLLALSECADPTERRSNRAPSPGALTSTQGPSSLHHASLPPQSGVDMFGNTTHANANAESDLSLFSPRSRRRIQKRLYMRRKRGTLREGVIDTGTEKLKPGKKARSNEASTSMGHSEVLSDTELEETENVRKKNKGGLTLPYKLKAQFAELGIDAAYLCSEGMDLMNLGALGKMMGLYSSGEEEEDASVIVQSIDAQLIRHLQAAMVSFVTDIVHRAIVWREREISLKQRSQVWRQGEHITIPAIEHAVKAIGARYPSYKEYFSASAVEAPSVTGTSLSPHRNVYTPLLRPPSGCTLAYLTRTYEREATRTRRGPSAEMNEDDHVISDVTDDELDEEEVDVALARREETRLWAMIKFN